jgi:uncharacterized membrane protein YcaP (DUF421 family)
VFFDSWAGLGRTIVAGVFAYAALVGFLRVSGQRTLSKMNAFDLVVTVALGSTLSTVLVSRQTPIVEGVVALLLLILLQLCVSWGSVHWPWFEEVVKSEPAVLVIRATPQRSMMRRHRVTESEILAAARGAGYATLDAVGLLILETDGSFSVISMERLPPGGAADLERSTSVTTDRSG